MIDLQEPDTRGWYVDGVDAQGARWFATVERGDDDTLTSAAAQPLDRRVAERVDGTRRSSSNGMGRARSIVVQSGDTLQTSFPGSTRFASLPRQSKGPALYVRMNDQVVLELQQKPPRVFVHDVFGSSVVARHYERARLPADLVALEAVLPLPATEIPLVIGRAVDGSLVASALSPNGDAAAVRLPKDAVFRGVHRPDENRPFDVVVDYTLPGDAVELESLRHAPLTLA
jgi:hypothetical protein